MHLQVPLNIRPTLLAAAAILSLLAMPAFAADEPSGEPVAATDDAGGDAMANDPTTPRGAMRAFLVACRAGDFERAATHLDLSPVPKSARASEGPRLARRLKLVLDRELWVDLESMSADEAGHQDDGLPSRRDRVGTIETKDGPFEVTLDRLRDASGERHWAISARTVAEISDLYSQYGWGPLAEWLPDTFFHSEMFNVQLWQWLALLILLVVAYVLSWVVVRLGLVGVVKPLTARSETTLDDRLLELTAGPLRLAVAVVFFTGGMLVLGLSPPATRFFGSIEKVLFVLALTWLLIRLVDVFGQLTERKLVRDGQATALSLVPLGRKGLKLAVILLATLAALDSFGFDVTALIAGLGVGGLAIALAAQKTLENLFGGATLLADRAVRVGDFCRFGDRVGTVEEIGLRSTRVRTLDRTIVTVPNAEFSTLQLENFAERERIWFHPRLGLRYETTPDQLRYVLVEIRRMLYAHPKVDPDPARVRFVGFGDSSLDIDIHSYVHTREYTRYLEIAEDLNLRIMDIVAQAGTGFAFPSSTTYLAKDDGVDAERGAAAERAVAEWRERGELFLPEFPPSQIQKLSGQLPWPPEGTPGSGSKVGA